jgi:hypothetical protein
LHKVNLQLVKSLTEAGANLLEEINKKETVLTIAIRSFRWIENKRELLLIIKYILEHPQLNQNVDIIHNGANNPQIKMLLNSGINSSYISDDSMLLLFKLIINSQFKDVSYLENVKLEIPKYLDLITVIKQVLYH